MKKRILSLLLVLILVFALAAPASAATYVGLFSRDDTHNGHPYLLSARCYNYSARSSVSYADTTVLVMTSVVASLSNGGQISATSPWSYGAAKAELAETSPSITSITATFKIGSTEWSAKVVPG